MALAPRPAVFYEIIAEHAGADLHARQHGLADELFEVPDRRVHVFALDEDFPIEGWCMTVRTFDAAGNLGAPATTCEACMWQEREPGGLFVDWHPVPGGPCDLAPDTDTDTGTGTGETPTTTAPGPEPSGLTTDADTSGASGGEEVLVPHGCSCDLRAPGVALGWLLVPLALVRRARRSA